MFQKPVSVWPVLGVFGSLLSVCYQPGIQPRARNQSTLLSDTCSKRQSKSQLIHEITRWVTVIGPSSVWEALPLSERLFLLIRDYSSLWEAGTLTEKQGVFLRGRASHCEAGPIPERQGLSQWGKASQIRARPLTESITLWDILTSLLERPSLSQRD